MYKCFDFAFRVKPGVDPLHAVAYPGDLEEHSFEHGKVGYTSEASRGQQGNRVARLVEMLELKGRIIATGGLDIDAKFRGCGAVLIAAANTSLGFDVAPTQSYPPTSTRRARAFKAFLESLLRL